MQKPREISELCSESMKHSNKNLILEKKSVVLEKNRFDYKKSHWNWHLLQISTYEGTNAGNLHRNTFTK